MEIESIKSDVEMSWEKVILGDIVKMVTGKTPPTKNAEYFNGDLLWINPSDFGSKYITDSKRTISQKAVNEKKCNLLPVGTILLSCIGDIGKIGILKSNGSSNQQITGLITNEKVLPDYLYYYLMFKKSALENLANKAVVAILNNERLRELEVELPPLATQKRIAEILDAADALRRKDQELLKKYDELAQAIFIDMFGDPVRNEKGWEVKKLNEVCMKITDGTHDTPERLTEGVKFITGKHIRPYFIDYDNSDYVTTEVHAEIYRRCNPEFGDILYTNIGVNYATAAMNTVNYEFSMKNVALLKYDRELLAGRFLEYQLNNEYFKDRLKTITGIGGAQQFLSLAQIKSINLLIPPLKIQQIFEGKINTLFASVYKEKHSIGLSNNLFDSLIQKAFKGELVS